MISTIHTYWVSHPVGWHVYNWRHDQEGTRRYRQPTTVLWVPKIGEAPDASPELLRRLAAQMELPLESRWQPPRSGSAPLEGPRGR